MLEVAKMVSRKCPPCKSGNGEHTNKTRTSLVAISKEGSRAVWEYTVWEIVCLTLGGERINKMWVTCYGNIPITEYCNSEDKRYLP